MISVRFAIPMLAAMLVLGACADGVQVSAGSDRGSVQGRLTEIGVDMADVESVEFTVERGEEGGIMNRWAWAKMKTCDGYIVVKTSGGYGRSGSQPYATGSCRLPEPRAAK
jgi:hypothetical protein